MINLKDILWKVAIEDVHGSTDVAIEKMEFDSRKVSENDVFIAIRGTISDGHEFIETAINKGAIAIICDCFPEIIVSGVTYIKVNDTNKAMAFMAANYFDNPSQKLKLIGITGTNGKTTIASLLFQLFQKAGFKKVYNLYGGIFHWVNEGRTVFANGKPTLRVHAYSKPWSVWLTKGEKVY